MERVGERGCEKLWMLQLFKGAEGVLQNVQRRCILEMVKFALQQAMQENAFVLRRDRKVCKFIDASCGLVDFILHGGVGILWRSNGCAAYIATTP
jgi:hypothetical protein